MALWTLPDAVRAAIVAFTVVTGAAGAVGVASVTAQESTPAVECVAPDLPPGTPSAMPEVGSPPPAAESTPEAEHDMAAMEEASPERVEVNEGTVADEDATATVTAAVENFAGCTTGDAAEDGRVSVDVLSGGFCSPGSLLHERWVLVDDAATLKLDETVRLLYPADVVVQAELRDYEFALSQTTFPAGQSIAFELTNTGTEPHEMAIAQLPEGATIEQAFNGEIPFEEINFVGVGFADPGQTGYMAVTGLEPGAYTIVCFIPSPDGTPHFVKGMVGEFVVE